MEKGYKGYDDLMSQHDFAEFYGVSQPMVHKYIRQGRIPEACIIQNGKYRQIKVDCAVAALEQNLDPARRKHRKPGINPPQARAEVRTTARKTC